MKRVVIVQARMGSTRLPGKVLLPINGQPMLAQQLRRLQRCRMVDDIVVATSRSAADDPIISVAEEAGIRWFRGDQEDVLGRFAEAAVEAKADLVVRVTADCPLVDPEIVDAVVERLVEKATEADYCSNVLQRTFPRGLDCEALFTDALMRTHRMATSKAAREHVTWFIYRERPELFRLTSVVDAEGDNSDLRWTVDTAEDLELIRKVFAMFELDVRPMPYRQLVEAVRRHPELCRLNASVAQKPV